MIKTMLIEDEKCIAEEFRKMLPEISDEIALVGSFSTIRESVKYLSENDTPDLIFSDVQLPDGLSFDIFNQVSIQSPVVFITGYDKFILNAFTHNGIDYLLKPVDENDLRKALARYRALENHFTNCGHFLNTFRSKKRSRLIVKKGIVNIALKTDEIVVIYTEDKLVFVIDRDGKKYRVDKKLAELEQELDTNVFFRANRQYIVNIGFIKSYRSYEKVKLQVDLAMPDLNHRIVVSQETAPGFRKWISEL